MRRFIARKSHKVGLAPGTLVPVEVTEDEPVRISVLDYDREEVHEEVVASAGEALPLRDRDTVSWINVDGLHRTEVIETLGEGFGLHPLVLEDILNTGQRPKLDDYGDYLFLVLKMLTFDEERYELQEEQISLVMGRGYVLSFQERRGDVLDPVRERIRSGKGRIRGMGSDYLVYALADAIVDHYFVVLERLGDWVEEVERELIEDPGEETMEELHRMKRELLMVRKAVWPTREVANALGREGTSLVDDGVRVFVRDLYDHAVQLMDTVETLRDLAAGMRDTYLTSVSNRMNEVMKVLTVMASLFIPLTFVAGVYGMNFERMPELGWEWGYPGVLLLMAAIAGGMLLFFRGRDWL